MLLFEFVNINYCSINWINYVNIKYSQYRITGSSTSAFIGENSQATGRVAILEGSHGHDDSNNWISTDGIVGDYGNAFKRLGRSVGRYQNNMSSAYYSGDFTGYYQSNVNGTFNVLEACRKHNIKKVVYSASHNTLFIYSREDLLVQLDLKMAIL
mgnify:CR=1 FL=1